MARGAVFAVLLMLGVVGESRAQSAGSYLGKPLGALSELHHGVRGRAFAVDARTVFLQDFHYDGEGPAAYFYVGTSGRPQAAGATRLRDERGGSGPLRRYRGEGVTLALPEPLTLRDVRWLAVWCDEYSVNFGDVSIPRDLEYPRPARVGALRGVHGVSSDNVVVVDAQTLLVPNFSYDGEAPDAKFWVGRGDKPSPAGIRIPDENGKEAPLRKYDKKTIVLTLPGELTVFDIGHFAVWCEAFTVNFGHVVLPRAALQNVPPSLKMLGVSPQSRNRALVSGGAHAQSTGGHAHKKKVSLTALPATTYRPQLRAGTLPHSSAQHAAALRRRADNAAPAPQQLLQPDTQHQQQQQYDQAYQQQKNLEYQQQQQFQQQQFNPYQQVPQQLLQQQYYQSFAQPNLQQPLYSQLSHHQLLLQNQLLEQQRRLYEQQLLQLQREAQALRQGQGQGQSGPQQYHLLPESRMQRNVQDESREKASESKLNCEVLYDELAFEVRWAVAGDSIVLQLVAKLEDGEYMSFGLSGDSSRSQMVGGDVAVAWVDKQTLKGHAVDYYLDAKSQCAGVRGSCPDERLGEKTNSIRLLNAALVNGYSIVTYQRSLKAADQLDRPVITNGSQPVIWALGPLNARQEVSYHYHFTKEDRFIEFGRPPLWNCPMPEGEEEPRSTAPPATRAPPRKPEPNTSEDEEQQAPKRAVIKSRPPPPPAPAPAAAPWDIPGIQCYEPPDGVFYAQMGPTGGKQGYPAITGHVGWGISWYINGLLIPEVTVVRGRRYTFVVEGGADPDTPARYHPFYITDDPVGGYYHKTDEEKKGVHIYAGVRRNRNGELVPTGVGRLCNWTPDTNGPGADEFPSFGAYQRSLTLVCEEGEPGVVTWTPDHNTPDTVYYQCFTHRYLGWKIHVVDACDEEGQESKTAESIALPEDLSQEESIQVATRLRPDTNFLDERKKVEKIINTNTNYNDFSSDKEAYSGVVSRGQIADVIQTVESIESRMRENQRPLAPPPGPAPHQYQVHEDPEAMPERPIREDEEYIVAPQKANEVYFLPPSTHPLTLQSVLRPGPGGSKRPNFRRPVPPEIKLRRPGPGPQNQGPHGIGPYGPGSQKQGPHGPGPQNQGPYGPGHQNQGAHGPGPQNPGPHSPGSHILGPQNQGPHGPGPHGTSNQNPGPHGSGPHGPGFHGQGPHGQGAPMQPPHLKPQFPLQMPAHHGPHSMHKKPYKPQFPRAPIPVKPQTKPFSAPKQPIKQQHAPVQTIIMGKPAVTAGKISPPSQSQTLSLGRTDIIANQVVKSQITLPGVGDSLPSSSIQQTFINQPGQIILGKPMDHPIPLDQQMAPSRQHVISVPSGGVDEPKTTTQRSRHAPQEPSNNMKQNEIKSSDFIGESTEPPTLRPAVNTGFKPNTIVIESGFKPIIREPLMDRTSDDYELSNNRREDIDVPDEYVESVQSAQNNYINHQVPSNTITQNFEPMFIPSPLDYALPSNDRTKEVFPSNHAKEDRPHPVYVKTETELNALFGKKNMEKEVSADMVMEADKVSPQYLPPDPKNTKKTAQKIVVPELTFTTYDGKLVSASTLTMVPDIPEVKPNNKPFSSKLHSADDLLKTPQFRPFTGDIPSVVAGPIDISGLPINNANTTLMLLNMNKSKLKDYLKTEASEKHEVIVKPNLNETKTEEKKENFVTESLEDYEDSEETEEEEEMSQEEPAKTENNEERNEDEKEKQPDNNQRHKREISDQGNISNRVERGTSNQIDFQADAESTAPRIKYSSSLLLPLLVKLF